MCSQAANIGKPPRLANINPPLCSLFIDRNAIEASGEYV
jgi:hypothetical protein